MLYLFYKYKIMDIIDKTVSIILGDILNPLIYLASGACFVYFLFGVFKFILAKYNADEQGVKKGKSHMLWGLIGLVIIFSAGAIYEFITSFFN